MDLREDTLNTGRGYLRKDEKLLMPIGVSSGLIAALVVVLYVGSEKTTLLYENPMFLICLAPLMIFWISRIWLLAGRGLINGDPVLFALRDKASYYTLLLAGIIIYIAS